MKEKDYEASPKMATKSRGYCVVEWQVRYFIAVKRRDSLKKCVFRNNFTTLRLHSIRLYTFQVLFDVRAEGKVVPVLNWAPRRIGGVEV
jgi:hypothetical protein